MTVFLYSQNDQYPFEGDEISNPRKMTCGYFYVIERHLTVMRRDDAQMSRCMTNA